jgi:hypothetical protein
MRYAFRHRMQISSLYVISHKLAILSGITPQWYDCCVNSCVAYINDYEDLEQCPECSQPRWISGSRRPRRMFCYIPLIPRLQKFFINPNHIKRFSTATTTNLWGIASLMYLMGSIIKISAIPGSRSMGTDFRTNSFLRNGI